jgi:hypothetical protein
MNPVAPVTKTRITISPFNSFHNPDRICGPVIIKMVIEDHTIYLESPYYLRNRPGRLEGSWIRFQMFCRY